LIVVAWAQAFALTTLIEAPIVVAATRDEPSPWPRRLALAVFAQLVTHPLVWFVFPFIAGITGHTSLALSELWAWLGEALFFAVALPTRPLRALGVSGVANGVSFAVGLLLQG
jgi:hypothetical protein